jgi:HTH-type transcriptional regulator/antitoxin HigA
MALEASYSIGVDNLLSPLDSAPPEHPGKILRRMLDAKQLNQDELAEIVGCARQTISGIISGKSGITAEMAVSLAAAFGNRPSDWLKWDAEYQLSLVGSDTKAVTRRARLFELAPIRDMQKRGWIKETTDLDKLEAEVERFYGGPLRSGIAFSVSTRRSNPFDDLTPADKAWCFRARQLSEALPLPAEFSRERLEAAEKKLRQLAAYSKEIQRLPQMLAYYGIRFVIVEPLPGAKIDGAAFWHNDHPIIAVSARWDRIDAFWFTVIHEFMHIKNGDEASVDVNLLRESDSGIVVSVSDEEAERRANEQAAELLVPQAELDSFIKRVSPLYAATRIIQFAHRIRIHPGIIVGQLQHRGELRYSAHRDLLVKVRSMVTETALTDGWGFSPTGI